MYVPLLSSYEPSNRYRRIASMESAAAILGLAWLMIDMPRSLALSLCAWAAILLLTGHGLAILTRSRPNQVVLWPEYRRRMGAGRADPPLDERDLSVRSRAFEISYRLLALLILAALLGFDFLVPRIVGSAPHRWMRVHDLTLELFCLLTFMVPLLPLWVLPWLEQDAPEEDDSLRLFRRNPVNERSGRPGLYPTWIRIIGSDWFIWSVIALLMVWVYRRYMPR